ncbi:MAG: arylsulfatase [Betaproteobacteria bacterium]|nr:arylsulfatase [Betaproteobacteria bacterium]
MTIASSPARRRGGIAGKPANALVFALVAAITACPFLPAQAAQRPHIVYLMPDDLGWQDLGYLGKEIRTPNIDRIADGAVRLNQFYVQPHSSQTRAAVMTGRYPFRYGLQTQSILPQSTYGLPVEERTLAQALKESGYRTAFVGKWQLGHAQPGFWPLRRGFDHFYGTLAGGVDHFTRRGDNGPDWYRQDKPVKETGYDTALIGKEAASVVAGHDPSKPLFLFVSFNAPAAPLQAPREFLDRNAHIGDEIRRTYAGMVSALDDAVGQILAALQKKGMLEDTLLVFHSDNGGAVAHKFPTGDGDLAVAAADNGPYRDGAGSVYEGGVRVPALVKWPRGLEAGVTNALIHVTDLYPTLLAQAGAGLDQRKPLDGIDQWPVIKEGKLGTRKDVPLTVEDLRASIRSGDWKLVVYSTLPSRTELYDIPHDPAEEDNAAERNPQLVQELLRKLTDFAWEMAPSRHLEDLARARKRDLPTVWGANPLRHGATARTDSRNDPSLTVERADRPQGAR